MIKSKVIADSLKSVVTKIYVKYIRGKWLTSATPQKGYKTRYIASKVKDSLRYETQAEAQDRADKYNAKYVAYVSGKYGAPAQFGRPASIPDTIQWDWFYGTDVQDEHIWWHDSGSWLYAHGWDDWSTADLLMDSPEMEYEDYQHSTIDFFKALFTTSRFAGYDIIKVDGEWEIYKI